MSVIDTLETCLKEADRNSIKRSRKTNTSVLVKSVVSTGLSNVGSRQYCKQNTFISASSTCPEEDSYKGFVHSATSAL